MSEASEAVGHQLVRYCRATAAPGRAASRAALASPAKTSSRPTFPPPTSAIHHGRLRHRRQGRPRRGAGDKTTASTSLARPRFHRTRTQKTICLFVVSSVGWLRLGSYGGTNEDGAHHEKPQRRRVLPAGSCAPSARASPPPLQSRPARRMSTRRAKWGAHLAAPRRHSPGPRGRDHGAVPEDELLNLDVLPDVFSDADAPPDDDDYAGHRRRRHAERRRRQRSSSRRDRPASLGSRPRSSPSAPRSRAPTATPTSTSSTPLCSTSCAKCNWPRCMKCAPRAAKKKRDQTTTCRHSRRRRRACAKGGSATPGVASVAASLSLLIVSSYTHTHARAHVLPLTLRERAPLYRA